MPGQATIVGIRKDPSIYGVYSAAIALQAGVVAANNFISLFNPAGSGKFFVVGGFFFSSYGIGTTTAVEPMRGFRCSTATGGTQLSVSNQTDISKYDTRFRDSTAEVRIANPACTLAAPVFSSPPPLGTGGIGTQFVHSVEPPPAAGGFFLLPGEGIVARTAAGDVDQLWNMTVVWGEGPS